MKNIYTLFSEKNCYLGGSVSRFVVDGGNNPLNPFLNYDFGLLETIFKEKEHPLRSALLKICDELWIFGDFEEELPLEISLAEELGKPTKYFEMDDYGRDIKQLK